ncbi:GtrA family protein [Enterovirga sp. DB1703]|uniref:GtrA family protein n=2 Tax=Enterovirga aerilata TaxID=2730920 RepID=A0A849I5J9_9HYPH|nr:GtrA family protein [Enterovirga sp. DB1703]
MRALLRQFSAFFGVGIAAAIVHYGLLVSLVEGYRMEAVRATLVGYVGGGIVSYLLNRRHTYASDRPHREAGWRFAVVALVGFGLTWAAMALFVRALGAPYLPAQVATTGIVLVWSFLAHKLWTFRAPPAVLP